LRFIGILLLSGYNSLPKEQDYWSNQPDLGVGIVSSAMSSKRFLLIKSMIHLVDNTKLDTNSSKVAKVLPLYDAINSASKAFGIFHQLLSVDESMVPYYGRHSCKMFIRGKPIRFGYKLWCMCGNDGYPYYTIIYTGKSNESGPPGTRVVQSMVDVVKEHSSTERHEIYFDNFFTSYQLLIQLANKI
jgi:DNA excision repair protein ERCC-6